MIVSDVRLEPRGDTVELSALVDGFRLYFRFPAEFPLAPRGDLFLAATIIAAMGAGEPLEIADDAPVSPRLLEGVERYQEIYAAWYPSLKKADIKCLARPAATAGSGVGLFFSGGIDSTYSFLRHRDEITHLVFCIGFDIPATQTERCAAAIEGNRRFADAHGKQLVVVETNARDLPGNTPLLARWGSTLIGVALAMGFTRVYIGASHSYDELMKWDTHPLTDELLSTEVTRVVHDGAERRSTKLQLMARESQLGIDILRVCNASDQYNCGKCEKCLRTMVALHLLGLNSPLLPAIRSPRELRKLYLPDDSALSFWVDNLRLARERGDRTFARALARMVYGYKLRELLKEIDREWWGGVLLRGRRALRGGGAK